MHEAIKKAIEDHVWMIGPNRKGCVTYLTEGVTEVANKLGISYEAANELVRSYIQEHA